MRWQVVERQSTSLSVFKVPVGEIPSQFCSISNQSYSPNFEAGGPGEAVLCRSEAERAAARTPTVEHSLEKKCHSSVPCHGEYRP